MPEPTFEQKKINWLEALLGSWYLPPSERPTPDWVPCRVRLKTVMRDFRNGTEWGTVAGEGAEIDVQSTVFGMPVYVDETAGQQIWLNSCEVEVLAFVPNVKKRILKQEAAEVAEGTAAIHQRDSLRPPLPPVKNGGSRASE